MECIYKPKPYQECSGFDCQPHPCVSFLRMNQEKYDSLKAYTVWAMVQKQYPNDDPEPEIKFIPPEDLTTVLEIARWGLSIIGDTIADEMDISTDETKRIHELLNEFLER